MRINSMYRTAILQMNPDKKMASELKKSMAWVQEFLNMSRTEIQMMLYSRFKELNIPMNTRTTSLLTKRFSGSATGNDKRFLYVDDDNSKFVFDKEWFLEVQLHAKTGKHIEPRVRIPVYKTELPYYDDIKDMMGYGITITEEGEKWFAYVQIPVESHEDEWKENVVGIDFNFRKWVASKMDGRPLIFPVKEYTERIDRIHSLISRKQSEMKWVFNQETKDAIDKELKKLYGLREFVVKEAHGNFISEIKKRFGYCTIAVEDVSTMFKLSEHDRAMSDSWLYNNEHDRKMTNNWLYKKTALSQFQLRAMAHGLNVVEVNPSYTSQVCHKCGHIGISYGKGGRLFKCTNCDLKDYHRDINASRNIAKLGYGYQFDFKALSEEKKNLKNIKLPVQQNF